MANKNFIVWAIDPFSRNKKVWNNTVQALNTLATRTKAEVLPVYVASSAEVQLIAPYSRPDLTQLARNAEKAVNKRVAKLRIQNLHAPKILTSKELQGINGTARLLCRFAQKIGAEMIVISSQSKTTIQRFFLGSFAESVLYQARNPVLLMGTSFKDPSFKRFFFSSDLSNPSFKALKSLIPLVKKLKSELVLYNAISLAPAWAASTDPIVLATTSPYLRSIQENERFHAVKNLERQAKVVRQKGIKVKVICETNDGNLANLIIKASQKSKASALCLASQSSKLSSALLGSVARSILRQAPLPVWLYRS